MSTTINLTTVPQSVPLLTGNQLMIVEHTGGNMVYYRSTSNVGPQTNDGVLLLGQTTQFYSGPVWFASDSTAQIIVTYISSPITPGSTVSVSTSSPANRLPELLVNTSADLVAALAACASGGGTISCAPGIYTGNFILPPRTIIDGLHPGLVTLTQANGANGDVVQGVNFLTLTGKSKATGDYALGCYESGVRNCTIDGNKANNATGYSIRLWGRALTLDNVWVQNGAQGDIWTEFTDVDTFADPAQKLEGFFTRIKSSNSGGDGWTFRGPHDSDIWGMNSYNHVGWMLTADSVVGSYQGSVRMYEANSYLNATGCIRTLNSGTIEMIGGSLTGAFVGTGFQASATSGACRLVGIQLAGRVIGFDLQASGHQIIAQIANMPAAVNSDVVKLNGCNGCQIILQGFTGDVNVGSNCNLVNCVSDLLNSVSGIVNAGLRTTLVAGTPNNQTYFSLQTVGNGGARGRTSLGPSNIINNAQGYTPSFSAESGTILTSGTGGAFATVAAGAAAGTSPTVTVTGNPNYRRGTLNVTVGTTPTTGVLATITLLRDTAPTGNVVLLTPKNALTAAAMNAAQVYATSTTTTLVVNCGVAPTAGQALSWDYFVCP